MLCALRPFAVPVRVVAGEHDEVVAEHVDDAGQDRLLGFARRPDVSGPQILLRVPLPAAIYRVAALLEMLVQPVDEERDPADTGLEERDAQVGVPVEDAPRNQRRHRRHLVERKADAMHLNVVREAVDTDLRKVHTRRTVDTERHGQLGGGRIERIQIGVIEVAVLQRRRDVGGHQPEILCLTHDVDRHVAVLDRRDSDPVQPAHPPDDEQ